MTKPTKEQLVGLDYFEKKAKHANRKEYFALNEEETEFIWYHPVFSQTKREALMTEFLETVQYCQDNDIDYFTNEVESMQYLQYLMIRYFSSVKDMTEGLTFVEHIAVLRQFRDSDFLALMVNEVFDIEEVSKISDDYHTLMTKMNKVNQELERRLQTAKKEQGKQGFKAVARKAVK